jgi:amidohydrolase
MAQLNTQQSLSFQDTVTTTIERHEQKLQNINHQIHSNPELKFEEYKAHQNICALLKSLGHSVSQHAYGLETSFETESGRGGRLIVFNAEYDALPGLGHACGHNLIATSSIAAYLATAEALKTSGLPGRVRLLGTPAEESGGGKIKLIKAGAYHGVDACLMAHPGPSAMVGMGTNTALDGVSATRSLARKQLHVTFRGLNAHAGLAPWKGRNALDAVVASYVNISLLRQQIPPSARVHGVIRKGGDEPNIIPDEASLEYFIRDGTAASVDELARRVESCLRAGAQATGCDVEVSWQEESDYKDLVPNMILARLFTDHMSTIGKNYLLDGRSHGMGASTDMGNVCYEVPGFHCGFSVGPDIPGASPHSPNFATAAGTRNAHLNALECAKGMALTALDILANDEYAIEMQQEFVQEFGVKSRL